MANITLKQPTGSINLRNKHSIAEILIKNLKKIFILVDYHLKNL